MDAIRKGKIMSRKRHTSEPIIAKLREAEVDLAKGVKVPQACKKLDRENGRLKRLLAEAELDKAILREAASGNG